MDFFRSSVERLLSNKNTGGLCRELKVPEEQAERIYSEHHCNFPITEVPKTPNTTEDVRSKTNEANNRKCR